MLLEPERSIGSLDFLEPGERHGTMPASTPALAAWRPGDSVHETISAHARTRPGHPAVVYQGQAGDYAWLIEQADALARRLHGLGNRAGEIRRGARWSDRRG